MHIYSNIVAIKQFRKWSQWPTVYCLECRRVYRLIEARGVSRRILSTKASSARTLPKMTLQPSPWSAPAVHSYRENADQDLDLYILLSAMIGARELGSPRVSCPIRYLLASVRCDFHIGRVCLDIFVTCTASPNSWIGSSDPSGRLPIST
jgi:hypothetical protein